VYISYVTSRYTLFDSLRLSLFVNIKHALLFHFTISDVRDSYRYRFQDYGPVGCDDT